MTIVVNPHNEQEEKVLLAFLDSLRYDYQSESTAFYLTQAQQNEILRRDSNDKSEARTWDEVKKDLERVYR